MSNAKDLLKKFGNVKATTPVKQTKKDERPIVEIPNEALDSFKSFAAAKAVFDVVESRMEAEKGIVNDAIFPLFVKTLYEIGKQPTNPKMEVLENGKVDMSGIFQVQTRYKIEVPEGSDPLADRLRQAILDNTGIPQDKVDQLMENEVDAALVIGIRNFAELMEGHYVGREFVPATEAEQRAGTKVLSLIMGEDTEPLTDAERELIKVETEKIKVKEGFLERVSLYCENYEQCLALLHILKPVYFPSHLKFAASDTPERRIARLKLAAVDMIGKQEEDKGSKRKAAK